MLTLLDYNTLILQPFINNYINKHKDLWIKEGLEAAEWFRWQNPLWFWAE